MLQCEKVNGNRDTFEENVHVLFTEHMIQLQQVADIDRVLMVRNERIQRPPLSVNRKKLQ